LTPVESGGERVQRVAVHDLELRHRNAARDAQILEQVIKPGLFLPGDVVAAGHRVDDRLVEEIGDHDPQRRADGGEGQGGDEIARRGMDVVIDRPAAVAHRFADQRAGEHHDVDQQEQPGEQQH
jgi:hypothetical protein